MLLVFYSGDVRWEMLGDLQLQLDAACTVSNSEAARHHTPQTLTIRFSWQPQPRNRFVLIVG